MGRKISLIDYDKTNMPNLALMKLSAYHKANGDVVDFYEPLFSKPDRIYCSKVFRFSPYELPNEKCEIFKGGTGFCIKDILTSSVEHTCPDYELYPNIDYSIGFITRGCIRNCEFCIVPRKEGYIRFNAHINEFQRHKKVLLLDNNILACDEGINELYGISNTDTKIDINQGLDSRLIGKNEAKLLSKINWINGVIRTACDSDAQFYYVKKATELLLLNGVKPYRIFCYVLVKSENDIIRILELDKLGVKPFAMGYMDFETGIKPQIVKDICRWVNHKAIFNVQKDFSKYIASKKLS